MGDDLKEGRKDGISLLDGPYASSFDSFKQLRVEANGLFKASAKPKFHPKVKPRNSALKYSSAKVKKKKEGKDYVPPTVDEKKEKQAVVFSYENLNVKDGDTVMEDVAKKEGVGPSEVKDETMLPAFAKPGKDKVVREIDVYLTPRIDRHTKLYLMQYPLRPYWKPYGLKKKCKEVRVKPKQSRLEIDLVMDTDEENYDLDAMEHLKITKQTLTSSKTPLSTSYALGMLRCNKLHLSPVHSDVQLRPLVNYVNKGEEHKKKIIVDEENEKEPEEVKPKLVPLKVQLKKETEWQEKLRLQSHAYFKQLDDAEPWIPLEAYGIDSPVTDGIRQKIVTVKNFQIPFSMNRGDYVNTLVTGRTSAGLNEAKVKEDNRNDGFSRCMDSMKPSMNSAVQSAKSAKVIKHGQVTGRGAENGDMCERTIPEETRAALPGALREILSNRVCTYLLPSTL